MRKHIMVLSTPPEVSGLSENQCGWLDHLQTADESGRTLGRVVQYSILDTL
jgi:hypothetical protein